MSEMVGSDQVLTTVREWHSRCPEFLQAYNMAQHGVYVRGSAHV